MLRQYLFMAVRSVARHKLYGFLVSAHPRSTPAIEIHESTLEGESEAILPLES